MTQEIVIADLDGCFSDDRERRHLLPDTHAARAMPLTEADWHPYHEGLEADNAINWAEVQSAILAGHHIAFITARPDAYEMPTLRWLHRKWPALNGASFGLHMRPRGNVTKSPELKVSLFEEEADYKWSNVITAYDDRDDVLFAYAAKGVRTLYNATENGIARLTNTPRMQEVEPLDIYAYSTDPVLQPIKLSVPDDEPQGFASGGYTKQSPDGGHEAYLHGPQSFIIENNSDDLDAEIDAFVADTLAKWDAEKPKSVPDILEQMAKTFRERSKVYGPNYLMVGKVMEVMFPDGLPDPKMVHRPEWHLFELMIVKLTRLAVSELKHVDSVHDTAVYGAMIEFILETENAKD